MIEQNEPEHWAMSKFPKLGAMLVKYKAESHA